VAIYRFTVYDMSQCDYTLYTAAYLAF